MTSLPSNFGIGDLGPWSFRLIDLFSEAKQNYWMILPLNPTNTESGNSPYTSDSAYAMNSLLTSPELLAKEGLLSTSLTEKPLPTSVNRIDYSKASRLKHGLIRKAYSSFRRKFSDYSHEFEDFCSKNSYWLDEYVLYSAIKKEEGKPWYLWPEDLRDRDRVALSRKEKSLKEHIDLERFTQFIVFDQWCRLTQYSEMKGVHIIGDVPFYVSHDSADLWCHPDLFKVDSRGRPTFVSGVPPDYFSSTGQLWGNPVYNWDKLAELGFNWWMDRLEHGLELFDLLRLDHFRGFLAYWEVPAEEETAINGSWVKTPSEDFLKKLVEQFPHLPFIAEDLGVITPDVRQVMSKLGIPGMHVLVFAFSGSLEDPDLPRNHKQNSIVFTGTHDTNTVRGWFTKEATDKEKKNLYKYVGRELGENEVSWQLIELAMASASNLCIVPMQDILALGDDARMNHPATTKGNWEWRVSEKQLASDGLRKLKEITKTYGRN